jgi:ankyrin repeat protein
MFPEANCKLAANKMSLHHALENRVPIECIEALIAVYPEGTNEIDPNGRLPIHIALANNHPIVVIEMLLHASSDSVQVVEGIPRNYYWNTNQYIGGNLPLHIALKSGASSDVISMLIHAYPVAVKKGDSNANLPLHLAMMNNVSINSISLLLDTFPEATMKHNRKSKNPLALALEHKASLAVVKLLIAASPQSLCEVGEYEEGNVDRFLGYTRKKKLSLHYAAEFGVSPEIFDTVLSGYPEAVSIDDGCRSTEKRFYVSGIRPLEYAIKYGQSYHNVDALLTTNPNIRNVDSLVLIAIGKMARHDVIARLLMAKKVLLREDFEKYIELMPAYSQLCRRQFEIVIGLLRFRQCRIDGKKRDVTKLIAHPIWFHDVVNIVIDFL